VEARESLTEELAIRKTIEYSVGCCLCSDTCSDSTRVYEP
jgi:hypothetical protein